MPNMALPTTAKAPPPSAIGFTGTGATDGTAVGSTVGVEERGEDECSSAVTRCSSSSSRTISRLSDSGRSAIFPPDLAQAVCFSVSRRWRVQALFRPRGQQLHQNPQEDKR